MATRRWAGSWLGGAGTPAGASGFPGKEFGLPEHGPGSVATMGRRLGALLVDWLLCTVIALYVFHSQMWTLGVFAAENFLLTSLTGFTVGKRLLSVRVARMDGRPVGFAWGLLRTVLLLAVVPPLVTDGDLRGLHDRAANTIVIRT